MITKQEKNLIKMLRERRNRNELRLFLIEGEKSLSELLDSNFFIELFVITKEFFDVHKNLIENKKLQYEILPAKEIEKLGNLESNDAGIAIVKQNIEVEPEITSDEIILALDTVQDPGNLGTIIRIADWYGIKKIIASLNTADFYNSKVIGASMGSFTRVKVFYRDLEKFLSEAQTEKIPVFGAYLNGEDIHKSVFAPTGILLMGNESKGISENLEKFVSTKITIPSFGNAESLNVGVATAVILDEWRSKN